MIERFLVFTRADRHEWRLFRDRSELSRAIELADNCVDERFTPGEPQDVAVVMEVVGVDAVPKFIYRYGVKRKGGA